MDFWPMLGFSSTPYIIKPLPASEAGYQMLVGRDEQLRSLLMRIRDSDMHPVLEGPNGVGKTSLVSVAAWKASDDFINRKSQRLYLPLAKSLQITDNPSDFIGKCYYSIAKTFIDHADLLKESGRSIPDLAKLRSWLSSPVSHGWGGGVNTPVGGVSLSRGSSPNATAGFSETGFQSLIYEWLSTAFPENSGGLIGIIDNLELIETTRAAQQLMEQLRDPILNLPGMRWVLCGARGIARSVAATPRLNGVLADPIDVSPVSDSDIPNLIAARIRHHQCAPNAVTPVNASSFKYIYDVIHQNLRDALKYSQDFSLDMGSEYFLNPNTQPDRAVRKWMRKNAINLRQDITLQPRVWRFFDDLSLAGGVCSPGDHSRFDFSDRTHMRKNVVELERVKLVASSRDDGDQRRRSIEITTKGWLLHFARTNSLGGDTPLPGFEKL